MKGCDYGIDVFIMGGATDENFRLMQYLIGFYIHFHRGLPLIRQSLDSE